MISMSLRITLGVPAPGATAVTAFHFVRGEPS